MAFLSKYSSTLLISSFKIKLQFFISLLVYSHKCRGCSRKSNMHKKIGFLLRISAVNVKKYVDFTVNFSINYSNFQVKGMFIKNPGKF